MSFRGFTVIQFEAVSLLAHLLFMSLREIAEISETSEGRLSQRDVQFVLDVPS
jgi:hypothetical protein